LSVQPIDVPHVGEVTLSNPPFVTRFVCPDAAIVDTRKNKEESLLRPDNTAVRVATLPAAKGMPSLERGFSKSVIILLSKWQDAAPHQNRLSLGAMRGFENPRFRSETFDRGGGISVKVPLCRISATYKGAGSTSNFGTFHLPIFLRRSGKIA
jgi:hypothetical protein